MALIPDAITIFGFLLDGIGALIMVTPRSEFLYNSIGRIFWRTKYSYDKFTSIEHEYIILIDENETILPAYLVSVFDLNCEPADIDRLVKDGLGEDANLEIHWEGEGSTGTFGTSYERAKDRIETTNKRRYLRRGAGFLMVGIGLQIVATVL